MRIAATLRAASLSAALCLPLLSLAPPVIAAGETYDYETDLWPMIQDQMKAQAQVQDQVEVAQRGALSLPGTSLSDVGTRTRLPRVRSYYDQLDPYLDPRTGVVAPEARGQLGD